MSSISANKLGQLLQVMLVIMHQCIGVRQDLPKQCTIHRTCQDAQEAVQDIPAPCTA